LRRFRGLFKTENSARKGDQCHEQTRPIHRSFAEKLFGWLEPPIRSIPGIAREIGVCNGTLRNWVNQDEIDSGERAGLTTEEKEELRKLGREVKTLRQEKGKTTRRDPSAAPAPGSAWQGVRCRSAQSRVWLAHITYIPTQERFLYLAFILDAHSR
jgi:transposase